MKFIVTSSSSQKQYELPNYFIGILSENMIQVKTKEYDGKIPKIIRYIEIETLEDLLKIMNLTDNLIILKSTIKGFDAVIEIYDDYRE